MPVFSSRPSRLRGLWAILVLAAVGWGSTATAQQGTPSSLLSPDTAPPPGTVVAKDTTLDSTPAPGTNSFQPPKVLKHPTPGYPELANLNRVEGVVGVHFSIDDTGKVTSVFVDKTSGSLMLDTLVLDPALREWTFQPATLNGKPVSGGVRKEFEFRLDPKEQRDLAEKRLALAVGTPDPPYPPEALALHPPPGGKCTVGVRWTKAGLVDLISLPKGSGSNVLDRAAVRFAYANWRTDTATAAKGQEFTKEVSFTPPAP